MYIENNKDDSKGLGETFDQTAGSRWAFWLKSRRPGSAIKAFADTIHYPLRRTSRQAQIAIIFRMAVRRVQKMALFWRMAADTQTAKEVEILKKRFDEVKSARGGQICLKFP